MAVERERIRILNEAPLRADGARYVLYWSQMNRRTEANHALLHAAELANGAGLPLLVYEGLTCTYRCANDRMHTFILQGVEQTGSALKAAGVGYFFYLRERRDWADDLLYRLSDHAACVVTDDYPYFIAAAHNASVPGKIAVRYVAVDSSCVVPMSRHEKRAWAAYTIRPKIRRELAQWLKPADELRVKTPWRNRLLPGELAKLRTPVSAATLGELVARCEIDHSVKPSVDVAGGAAEAERRLQEFLHHRLARYAQDRNEPSKRATSGLSPYLHFGQISSLHVALAVQDYAARHKLFADEYLEELIVRRELAFNFARFTPEPESLEALPDWCRRTMAKHAEDPRPTVYTREEFEQARTYDELWNATQTELLHRGVIHGYYRMYWGKKIIEWSESYKSALRTMIELHEKYALDGRDPNTCTNILWCFGLHDRPWGERSIFGQLRYMSLEGMRRKTDTRSYIAAMAALR